MKIRGIIPPLITPFKENGEIYEGGLKQLIDFQIENGVHGFWLCGTYGCGPLMTSEQRKKVAKVCVDYVDKRVPVIVHVGSSSLESTLDLAKHAESIGADAVGSVPPFYYPYKENEILAFYKELVSAVKIPVFAYNNPATTKFNISPEFLNELATIGVVGIKDSSFNITQFYEYLTSLKKEEFIFIVGTEALLFPALTAGAKGCVSGLANAFPEINVQAYNAIQEKNWDKAIELQLKIIKARKILHTVSSSISACYTLLKMRGVDVGVVKKPITPLTEKESKYIKVKLKELGFPLS
ncbi:MAG: dihydrodipicolinate synthase family protein [Candidatus Baldrarchaeia archaeon]